MGGLGAGQESPGRAPRSKDGPFQPKAQNSEISTTFVTMCTCGGDRLHRQDTAPWGERHVLWRRRERLG